MGMETESTTHKAADSRALLRNRGLLQVTVHGECMRPALRTGDVVLVHRPRPPRVGDVALLDCRGWLEIHRLVGRIEVGRTSWYVHMGDASTLSGIAAPTEILGLIPGVTPRRLPALRAHLLTLFYRLAAALLFLAPGLRTLWRAFRQTS